MSNPKAEAKSMIEGLPEDASLEDIQYHLYVLEKVRRGLARAQTEGTLSHEEARILKEEMARIRARSPLESFGIWMLGPALLAFGSEEQKKELLPQVAQHIRNFRRVKVKDGRTIWEITAADAQYFEHQREIVVQVMDHGGGGGHLQAGYTHRDEAC